MSFKIKNARDENERIKNKLSSLFKLNENEFIDYICLSFKDDSFLVLKSKKSFLLLENLMCNHTIFTFFNNLDKSKSYLLDIEQHSLIDESEKIISLDIPVIEKIDLMINDSINFGGYLNEQGGHVIDLKCQNVSPHYDVNLLLGDRMDFPYPLQSTPKSVVNRFFQGSFRAHSSFQVLATTWGLRPEENGFNANRQFYILEDGKQIFYSAKIDDMVQEATCIHSVNHSSIIYKHKLGLTIKRDIFILPQLKTLPDAVEVQMISITNETEKTRSLSIVYTGMFGFSNPHCQEEDVIYSTLISQAQVIQNEKKEIVAITPDYYPEYFKREMRFCILKDDDSYASSFTTDYTQFIGRGSLEAPEHLSFLDNKLSLRGPNFFALGKSFVLKPHDTKNIDTFTGMVDAKDTKGDDNLYQLKIQIDSLLRNYPIRFVLSNALKQVKNKSIKYSSFLQIENSKDTNFKNYVNHNLPFQVLYQTFVSRSFAMTQKGYREIGFREIQDLYASMYYLYSCGRKETIKKLLSQWIENVHSFGFANHNFFFVGKEPGMCSDDSLWLIFAISYYLNLSDDYGFLNKKFIIADKNKKRSVYETLKTIILYSSMISVGKHGLPLLDCADWNDCLRIDPDYLNGIKKEKAYQHQLKKNKQTFGVPFENEYSESVMNGFLLVIALKDMIKIATRKNDISYVETLKKLCKEKEESLQNNAYIDGYFARVLINRENENHISYIGSKGDKLSLEKNCPGSYYLNSFSWSLLSDVANEKQIKEMLDNVVDKHLKTKAGYRLCTSHNLSLAGAKSSSTDHYFVGDRENGGVFKHATMMFTKALLYRAKTVKNEELKKKMVKDAYYMLNLVYPYKTLDDVCLYKGNPRFCTQYNNSNTMENIGPMLSGTASWLTLTIFEALGINIENNKLSIIPMLDLKTTTITYKLNIEDTIYSITIKKKKGDVCDESKKSMTLDGKQITFPLEFAKDNEKHEIIISYL